MTVSAQTQFAPAAKAPSEDLEAVRRMLGLSDVPRLLNAIPVLLLLLNRQRQIVYANAKAQEFTRLSGEDLTGLRPGEALNCAYVDEGPCGCGTSHFCSRCGAVRSILMSGYGRPNTQECNMLVREEGHTVALDLLVSSSPFELEGRSLTLFTIQDTGNLGRRRNTEHLFFHDVLNTVGSLRGLTDILRQEVPPSLREDADFIHDMLGDVVEELLFHKQILAAEKNELAPVFTEVDTIDLVDSALRMGHTLPAGEGRRIAAATGLARVALRTDSRLVRRVLGNMVKNALEASGPGEEVLVGCVESEGGVAFHVSNPAVMNEDVQYQVFKRNYSTKGLGRGLGTYGMKLLGEGYLKGRVSFASREGQGTVFTLWLPLSPEDESPRAVGS